MTEIQIIIRLLCRNLQVSVSVLWTQAHYGCSTQNQQDRVIPSTWGHFQLNKKTKQQCSGQNAETEASKVTVYGFSSVIFISSTCVQWPNHPPQYINTLFSSVTWQIVVSTCSESFQKFLMLQFVLHHALSCFTDARLPTWLWPQTDYRFRFWTLPWSPVACVWILYSVNH